jgi:D-glycero-D-manno-heptose 1,7-bisphosphate phosphatase
MRPAVIIERDGILNHPRVEKNQPVPPLRFEDFHINEDAIEPIKELKAAGFLVIVTTNQPGLSRGTQSRRELDLMHGMMRRKFPIDDLFICPHDEMDRCPCRKPKPGLIKEAIWKWQLDMDRSFVISDKWQDAQAAHVMGCTSILLQSPWNGKGHHDFVLPDIPSLAQKILQLQGSSVLCA